VLGTGEECQSDEHEAARWGEVNHFIKVASFDFIDDDKKQAVFKADQGRSNRLFDDRWLDVFLGGGIHFSVYCAGLDLLGRQQAVESKGFLTQVVTVHFVANDVFDDVSQANFAVVPERLRWWDAEIFQQRLAAGERPS